MAEGKQKIGWIGIGRMGYPMAERLLDAGRDVAIWNRTRAKAEPLAKKGGRIVDRIADLADVDVLFTIVSTGRDVEQVLFGDGGVAAGKSGGPPKIFVDCSTIGVEESAAIRRRLAERGADFVAAPVSGNAKCVKAGKLSAVISGPEGACRAAQPLIELFAPRGVSYVGEGELARICKIAHNVFLGVVIENLAEITLLANKAGVPRHLGVVIENLAEITLLANKAGVPRHAFLSFINTSVMGSIFTAYKTPAFVNLDWTTTFTPELMRKDLDLGLELGRELEVPMPVTATAREELQAHFGAATLKPDPATYLRQDFAALLETLALGAGMKLTSENKNVPTGLET